ncbi:hypothetical protein M2263_000496 [Providencia alcalifaciens]|nr:hypothetical protein [Providencia alcalifaciens]
MKILNWMRNNKIKFLLSLVVVFEGLNYLVTIA